MICQVKNEGFDMSYVALFFARGLNNKLNTVSKLSICLANFYIRIKWNIY